MDIKGAVFGTKRNQDKVDAKERQELDRAGSEGAGSTSIGVAGKSAHKQGRLTGGLSRKFFPSECTGFSSLSDSRVFEKLSCLG